MSEGGAVGVPANAWRRASLLEDLRARWIGRAISELETPALLVDTAVLDANIQRMAARCASLGKSLRPHAKVHKCSTIAERQLRAGAVGLTCSTASEAEVMVDNGLTDVLVSTVVGSPAKARRLASLASRARVTAVVDAVEGAGFLSDAAERTGTRIPVLVDVNIGQNRTGVEPGLGARVLAEQVDDLPGIEFIGLQGYDGHSQRILDLEERARASNLAMTALETAYSAVVDGGLDLRVVTCGGTGTFALAGAHPWVTELQPGAYVLMDHARSQVQPAEFAIASTLMATVIGRYFDHLVVDVGTKAIATDKGQPIVLGYPGAEYLAAGDEHGIILGLSALSALHIGDVLELVSAHIDATVNLHSVFFACRSGRVEDIWPIEARGCSW